MGREGASPNTDNDPEAAMADTLRRTTLPDDSVSLAENRTDGERLLDALQELELRAGSPAPAREAQWLQHMLAAQHENSADDASILSDIQRDQPRLHNRVMQLRRDNRDLNDAVTRLHTQLEATTPDAIHFADFRHRLDRVATELRYQRAREADLIYEAFNVDLGAGDLHRDPLSGSPNDGALVVGEWFTTIRARTSVGMRAAGCGLRAAGCGIGGWL